MLRSLINVINFQ